MSADEATQSTLQRAASLAENDIRSVAWDDAGLPVTRTVLLLPTAPEQRWARTLAR